MTTNDNKTLSKYTSSRLLHALKKPDIDIKVREAFSAMSNYQENIYMYGLKAVVEAKAQTQTQGEVAISFEYIWKNGRWLLGMVR